MPFPMYYRQDILQVMQFPNFALYLEKIMQVTPGRFVSMDTWRNKMKLLCKFLLFKFLVTLELQLTN